MKHRTRLTALVSVSPFLLLSAVLLFTGCPREPAAEGFYDHLVIDTFAPGGGGSSDTFLILIDHTGNELATDSNGNPDQVNHLGYSRIDYLAGLSAGTYYIRVNNPTDTDQIYYGIRVVDYDPGASFPVLGDVPEDDGGSDDPVDGNGVPLNPVLITLGEAGAQSRAIFPRATDIDWFKLVLP